MIASRKTLPLLATMCGWILATDSVALAEVINVPDDFPTIQSAIDAAVEGDEVVVATGTYSETINLLGKAIIVRSTDPGSPPIVAATTIDGNGLGTSVITCDSGEGADTVIDGLTIQGGNATNGGGISNTNGSSPTVSNCRIRNNTATERGGGMYNDSSDPTVTNCTFVNNQANLFGGGMYNDASNPTVTDCTFNANDGSFGGGGMYNDTSNPTVIGCTFSGNDGHPAGGGMFNTESSPTVTDCTFSENEGTGGGGMDNEYSSPMVTNCVFSENAGTSGGGMKNSSSTVVVTGCTFSDNSATSGGGMNNNESDSTVTSCTFSRNSATSGGGMSNNQGDVKVTNCLFTGNFATSGAGLFTNNGDTTVSNCTFTGNSAAALGGAMNLGTSSEEDPSPTINNCIVWGNFAVYNGDGSGSYEIWLGGFVDPEVNYCNVQGGFPGLFNIDADPLFVDPGFWDDNGTPGNDGDDFWIDGDYHLLAGSPVVDAANNTAVPADTADLDGDGDTDEQTPFDLDGNPRFHDDPAAPDCPQEPGACGTAPIVDMGAYEFQPPCEGDANDDGNVDPLDSGYVLARFGCPVGTGDPSCDAADQNGDGAVDPLDSGFVLARFGACP